ncbi:MAG: hypothetical protein N2Z40_00550 [Caldimicrobium sp.]|nr:hypothetical protein [Caldimicrobium sp.]MCX7612701.1 hypothetical protein [Caldimicrobium sp.]MDW8182439.1 hypothetical protein [Caldimicrobium sp.]
MKCPGQDLRYWREDAIFEVFCPFCKETMEFFRDDTVRRCSKCGKPVPNPRMDFGCAVYCKYAEACLGELPQELIKEKANLLKGRLLSSLENRISRDLFQRVEKNLAALEKALSGKRGLTGSSLIIFLIYYLPEKGEETFYKSLGLPHLPWEDLKAELERIPKGLSPDELREYLIKREELQDE